MKSNKKSTANFINILLTSKSLTNTNLSNINVTYKETNNNNRSPNLEAYINNCVSFSDGHHPEGDIMKVIYTAGLILIGDYWDLIVDYLVGGRS